MVRRPDPLLVLLVLLAALVAVAFFVPSVVAQEESASKESAEDTAAAWPAVFRDTTEVRVVNVEVIVTDRDGHPVAGLGREDFELIADGEPVEISNFYAVEGGRVRAAAAEPASGEEETAAAVPAKRRLHLAIFVDNPNISPTHRSRIFTRLRDLLLENRRDDVHITLIAPSRTASGLTVVAATDAPHEVFAALEELEETAAATSRLDVERRQIVNALSEISVHAGYDLVGGGPAAGSLSDEELENEGLKAQARELSPEGQYVVEAAALLPQIRSYSQQRFETVLAAIGSLGRAVDLLAGFPGKKALLYVSDGLPMRSGEALIEGYANRIRAMDSGGRFSPESEVSRYDASQHFTALMRRSNAAKVSFYTLDAAPSGASQVGSAETASTFHLSGFNAIEEGNRESSLVFMAEESGGVAALGTAAYPAALQGIYDDFDNHYSLGFMPAEGEKERRQTLEAKVRGGKGYDVRYRRGWSPRTRQQRMTERTLAALLFDEADNSLGIALKAAEPTLGDDGNVHVPLLVEVPLGKLVLLPQKTEHVAQLSLYLAARDEKGRTSEVVRHLCPIRIPNSEMLVALGRSMGCGVRIALRTGRQKLAATVHDEIGDVVATASLFVDVRKPPETAKGSKKDRIRRADTGGGERP